MGDAFPAGGTLSLLLSTRSSEGGSGKDNDKALPVPGILSLSGSAGNVSTSSRFGVLTSACQLGLCPSISCAPGVGSDCQETLHFPCALLLRYSIHAWRGCPLFKQDS